MNSALKILAGLSGLLFLTIALLGITAISTSNNLATQEEGIKAQYEQNQNNYDNFVKKVRETAQVPSMYADDLRNLYGETMRGRYGADGSRALLQFIKEHNPTLDAGLYRQVQQVIEAGRNSFAADQTTLIDKKRVYETTLAIFPNNILARFLGFPRIELAKYGIVTSAETANAFETKKAEPIKLR